MNTCGQGEIQIPMNNSFDRNHVSSLHVSHIIHDPPILNQMPPSNGIATHHLKDHMTSNRKVVRYRECLKNHAASMGGNATDGCGEFMPSGEEGTIEAFKCSACNCHRNFHRKDTEGDQYDYYQRKQPGLLVGCPTISRAQPPMIMPSSMSLLTPESDEQEGCCGNHVRPPLTKKRFRTKFTQEQKEKMIVFAEKIGWKLLKQEESVIQQFCQEIGVKRRVLKVWMHNNKHHLAKKDNNI